MVYAQEYSFQYLIMDKIYNLHHLSTQSAEHGRTGQDLVPAKSLILSGATGTFLMISHVDCVEF